MKLSWSLDRCLILFVLSLGFLAQSLIPAGYMPGTHKGTGFEMVICSGTISQTILVDEHMQRLADAPHKSLPDHDSKICPFATLATSLTPQIFHYSLPVHVTMVEGYLLHSRIAVSASETKYWQSQAPPAFTALM